MGIAVTGVVDSPRAADLLYLLLFGPIWNARFLGHLHHHRYAPIPFSHSL